LSRRAAAHRSFWLTAPLPPDFISDRLGLSYNLIQNAR
jgi:hypothetical protein